LELIEVARIIKPHGLVGEVGVLLHWDESDVLERVKCVSVALADGTNREFEIARARRSGRGLLVQFVGVTERNAAESLRNARISVDRSVLPDAEPGEAYLTDLIGREVLAPDHTTFGKVVEIASYPSVESLVIERADGSRVEQPLVGDWVEPLDASPNQVILRSLDGLVG
jgi:16S rRNA processing protein RimM